jgi:hypothetical protein
MAKTACVACAHPKWDERPLLVAVSREGIVVSTRQVLDFFSGKTCLSRARGRFRN